MRTGTGRRMRWTLLAAGLVAAAVAAVVLVLPSGRGPGDPVSPARPAAGGSAVAGRPSVAFIGDSWTAGSGVGALQGYAVRTGEQLGWDYHVLGVGGSGYSLPGQGSTFGERIDLALSTDPDVVVVQGSLNERNTDPAVLRAAAVDTLTRLRAEAGAGTEIVVLGASYNPGTDDAVIDRINGIVSAAARRAGLTFVDVAAENWTDPHRPGIWLDPMHPNARGHQLIADRLVPRLRDLVPH